MQLNWTVSQTVPNCKNLSWIENNSESLHWINSILGTHWPISFVTHFCKLYFSKVSEESQLKENHPANPKRKDPRLKIADMYCKLNESFSLKG